MRLSLYGHPAAGIHSERYCHGKLKLVGFDDIIGWECSLYHRQLQVALSVYVDNFKLAGHAASLPAAWALIQMNCIRLDKICLFDTYNGYGQHAAHIRTTETTDRLTNVAAHLFEGQLGPGCAGQFRSVRYDVSGFPQPYADKYLVIAKFDAS